MTSSCCATGSTALTTTPGPLPNRDYAELVGGPLGGRLLDITGCAADGPDLRCADDRARAVRRRRPGPVRPSSRRAEPLGPVRGHSLTLPGRTRLADRPGARGRRYQRADRRAPALRPGRPEGHRGAAAGRRSSRSPPRDGSRPLGSGQRSRGRGSGPAAYRGVDGVVGYSQRSSSAPGTGLAVKLGPALRRRGRSCPRPVPSGVQRIEPAAGGGWCPGARAASRT